MINSIDPMSGFIDYINHIKPYHTKILETNVELVCSDSVSVNIIEVSNSALTNNRELKDPSIVSVTESILFTH